jgi:hypothetical protein
VEPPLHEAVEPREFAAIGDAHGEVDGDGAHGRRSRSVEVDEVVEVAGVRYAVAVEVIDAGHDRHLRRGRALEVRVEVEAGEANGLPEAPRVGIGLGDVGEKAPNRALPR